MYSKSIMNLIKIISNICIIFMLCMLLPPVDRLIKLLIVILYTDLCYGGMVEDEMYIN
ncbi:hypothetical protein JUM001_09760 [Clostridium perfringens]|nr:hypothetical protein JUM001_09760 [Clostridium perfringens]